MATITKEMCTNPKNNKWKRPFIFIIVLVVLEIIRFCLLSYPVWLIVFYIVIFGTVIVIAFFVLRKRFNAVTENKDFYIVEDTLINVSEINVATNRLRRFTRFHYRQYDYEIEFSCNGKHNVLFFSKEEPKDIDADYSAVFFSQPGDKFYLLMSKDKEEKFIVKAFNAKCYKLVENDFDYIDGRYYPRKLVE